MDSSVFFEELSSVNLHSLLESIPPHGFQISIEILTENEHVDSTIIGDKYGYANRRL